MLKISRIMSKIIFCLSFLLVAYAPDACAKQKAIETYVKQVMPRQPVDTGYKIGQASFSCENSNMFKELIFTLSQAEVLDYVHAAEIDHNVKQIVIKFFWPSQMSVDEIDKRLTRAALRVGSTLLDHKLEKPSMDLNSVPVGEEVLSIERA